MTSALYDLRYLQASLKDLEAFLLSGAGQWPVGEVAPHGEPPFPALTIEGVLLAQQRLLAHRLPASLRAEAQECIRHLDALRNRWLAAWERKAALGFHQRLRLWHTFLDELFQEPLSQIHRYPYEARLRVMLHLLAQFPAQISPQALAQLPALDQRLHRTWVTGTFIWEADLQIAFPADTFWYLYGRPATS